MIKKVLPLVVMGMAAQDYANKSGKKKEKIIVKDPHKELKKAAAKKRLKKKKKEAKDGEY